MCPRLARRDGPVEDQRRRTPTSEHLLDMCCNGERRRVLPWPGDNLDTGGQPLFRSSAPHDGGRPPPQVVHHHVREVADLDQAVMVGLGRGWHRRADDHVEIGHERQHLDAVRVDVDEAAPRLGQGEINRARLPQELGKLVRRIGRADRPKVLFEALTAVPAQKYLLPQQVHGATNAGPI
jgi:hypothetical protein